MDFKSAARGYANLWAKATIRPERRASALAIARKALANKARYEKIASQVGSVPWWWIAAIHNLEASGNFQKYLGNGQPLTMKTTIVPLGRGPFVSFEAGAVDALRLKKLQDIETWDIARALYEAERYNGFGYVGKINSPYVWSFTNLQQKGKYVRDHVWDPNYTSTQCGVAAVFKALEELGELKFDTEEEDGMAELRASILPFGALAPILIRTLAGPAATIAVKAIAEAFGEVEKDKPPVPANPDVVKQRLEEAPVRVIPNILAMAEEILKEVIGDQPDDHQPGPAAALPDTPAPTVMVQAPPVEKTVVVAPDTSKLGKVDRIFGGEWLAGLKTPIGIFLYCAAWVGGALGYLTPEAVSAVNGVATLFIGVGLTAKIDRFLSWLGPLTATLKR